MRGVAQPSPAQPSPAQPSPAQPSYTAHHIAVHHIRPAAIGGSPRHGPRPNCRVPARFATQLAVLRVAAVWSNLLQRAAISHCARDA